jgi:hypothetical protein
LFTIKIQSTSTGSITMPVSKRFSRGVAQRLALALFAGLLWLSSSLFAAPAYAADSSAAKRYIAADGTDLTAMAQCLPKSLSQGNFARVLQESKNDFLEKVFDVKDNYDDYKLDEAEVAYLACVEAKGVTPQVKR